MIHAISCRSSSSCQFILLLSAVAGSRSLEVCRRGTVRATSSSSCRSEIDIRFEKPGEAVKVTAFLNKSDFRDKGLGVN
jgi:hypothetical protein